MFSSTSALELVFYCQKLMSSGETVCAKKLCACLFLTLFSSIGYFFRRCLMYGLTGCSLLHSRTIPFQSVSSAVGVSSASLPSSNRFPAALRSPRAPPHAEGLGVPVERREGLPLLLREPPELRVHVGGLGRVLRPAAPPGSDRLHLGSI